METKILHNTSDLRSGELVDGYQLLECIQVGGEGALWTARHHQNHQIVIMKFVPQPDWNSVELFETERSPIIGLDHPNIREVIHSGIYQDIPFTCMRFYPSGSVQGLIDERMLSVTETLMIAAQITSALDYIHSIRIVHRDLKPTNLLIDSQFHVYLTDFGLARQVSDSTRLFHTGHGSAPYSPPEQHVREEITQRSDIYSFGIVLYRLFSGELPWEGKIALAIKQLESNTPLPEDPLKNSGLPECLIDGLRVLTERDPENRPKSAVESFGLIASILDGNGCELVSYETGKMYMDKFLAHVAPFPKPLEFEIRESKKILDRSTELWVIGNRGFDLTMTEFSYLDSAFTQHGSSMEGLDEGQIQLMAYGGIKYSLNHEYWWKGLKEANSKVELVDIVIQNEEANAIDRCLNLIVKYDKDLFSEDTIFTGLILSLLEVLEKVPGEIIGANALKVLEALAHPGEDWQDGILPASGLNQLADLAMANEPYSIEAAKLIGTLRLSKAVQKIWKYYLETEALHLLDSLILINQIAGSMPKFIPLRFRINLTGHVAVDQLASQRQQYLRSYFLTALLIGIGIGSYVFLSFRMPSIFNTARVLSSLGSALLIGPIIGMGVFSSGIIASHLEIIKKVPRTMLAIIVGTIFVSLGFIGYHLLFLDNPPMGWVIPLGSSVIVLGTILGVQWSQSKIVGAILGVLFTGLALAGSGYLTVGTEITPLLYYNYGDLTATAIKIGITALFFGPIPLVFQPTQPVE